MAEITAEQVKKLREKTGAGMMECKRALEEAQGDEQKAIDLLRQRGVAVAERRASKATKEGIIESYIHMGGKIGVMLELNCETDFVARTPDFKELARDIAMHIAWAQPKWIDRSEVPPEVIEHEKEIYRQRALLEGRPERAIPKIVEGRLEKFFQDNVLMDQLFIKDQNLTIRDLINEKIGRLGENIVLRRFVRMQVGEDL